jgi:hypothetical protein
VGRVSNDAAVSRAPAAPRLPDAAEWSEETVETLGVITPLNGTKWMLAPTFGCGMLTVKGSRGPLGQQFMDRPAGAGPGRAG